LLLLFFSFFPFKSSPCFSSYRNLLLSGKCIIRYGRNKQTSFPHHMPFPIIPKSFAIFSSHAKMIFCEKQTKEDQEFRDENGSCHSPKKFAALFDPELLGSTIRPGVFFFSPPKWSLPFGPPPGNFSLNPLVLIII
jgi:hypothetical protein